MELEITGSALRQEPITKSPIELDLHKIPGRVHFIGIGGIGMSAIARLLLAQGIAVSGSDREESSVSNELKALGAHIHVGHRAQNVEGASVLVVSTAIVGDNPELVAAKERNLPIYHRSQLLAYLSKPSKLIAVSGTHGKTTTTAMVSQVLIDGGLDPTVVIGGWFDRIASNAQMGKGQYFVAEADESDGTHVQTNSHLALITNIEADHLENYPGGIEQIRANMVAFANQAQRAIVLCQDDIGCRLIRPQLLRPVISYGQAGGSSQPDYSYKSEPGFAMKVFKGNSLLGDIVLSVPGEHNKLNALAAAVVALELGMTFNQVAASLKSFTGVCRRFQILGQSDGLTIVDDYAHHPTEVVATLEAAKRYRETAAPTSRIVAVFQPHQPGRLRDLWEEFCSAFGTADQVLITDIYIARGKAIDGISSEKLASAIKHPDVHYVGGKTSELPQSLLSYLKSGDLVLTIGAGDITKVGPGLLELIRKGETNGRDC